jgi:hypothetical protein
MSSIERFKEYTLDLLLEDAEKYIIEMNRRIYCDILVCYPQTFDSLTKRLEFYSDRKRSHWTVNMSDCAEEDFCVVCFSPKENELEEEPVLFFWKILRYDKYIIILSFSFHNYTEIRKSLDSLVRYVKGLWFSWIGSRFLETLDLFVRRELTEDIEVLARAQTVEELERDFPRRSRAIPLTTRKFIPLEDIRKWAKDRHRTRGDLITFSNMRYKLLSQQSNMNFTFSMTERSRITFERGDFALFMVFLRPLIDETRRLLGILKRNSYTTKSESTVFGKPMEIRSFDLIQSLVFKKSEESKEWYESIVKLFSSDIPKEKLVNFTLLSGNPYLLVHVVDVENSSSVYLSATSEDLHVVPVESSVKEETIAKIINILQAKVDPTITI